MTQSTFLDFIHLSRVTQGINKSVKHFSRQNDRIVSFKSVQSPWNRGVDPLHISPQVTPDKRQDIGDAMTKMKEQYALKNTDEFISFDDAYQYYCGVYKPKYVVNKRYLEKCVCEHVSGHVVYGTFISNTWYQG